MYRLLNNLLTRVLNTISPFALAPVPQDISLLSCEFVDAASEVVDPEPSGSDHVAPAPVAKYTVYGIEDYEYDDDDDDDADAPIIGAGPIAYSVSHCVDENKDLCGVSSAGVGVGEEESVASAAAAVFSAAAAASGNRCDDDDEVSVPVGYLDKRYNHCLGCNASHSVRGGNRGCFGVGRRGRDVDSVAESAAVDSVALSHRRMKRAHSDAFEEEQHSRQHKKQSRRDVEEPTLLKMVLLNESRKLREQVDAERLLFAPSTLLPHKRKMEGQGERPMKYRRVL